MARLRILIVDDDTVDREVIRRALTDVPVELELCDNARAALEWLRRPENRHNTMLVTDVFLASGHITGNNLVAFAVSRGIPAVAISSLEEGPHRLMPFVNKGDSGFGERIRQLVSDTFLLPKERALALS